MFHRIITKLNAYIKKESFFISRLIRYNLVELGRHYQQNRYYRNLGFQYLLMLCLISYLFFYTFGIYHRIQNGCSYLIENGKSQWEGCDNRHEKIINDEDNILSVGKALKTRTFWSLFLMGLFSNSKNIILFKFNIISLSTFSFKYF